MSASRSHYLSILAQRKFDRGDVGIESDSSFASTDDGGIFSHSDYDEGGRELIFEATPPRVGARSVGVRGGSGSGRGWRGGSSTNNIPRANPPKAKDGPPTSTPPKPDSSSPSVPGRRRSSLRPTDRNRARQQQQQQSMEAATERNDQQTKSDQPTHVPPSPSSSLMRRAEVFHRRKKGLRNSDCGGSKDGWDNPSDEEEARTPHRPTASRHTHGRSFDGGAVRTHLVSKNPQVEELSPTISAKRNTRHVRGRSFDGRAAHLVSVDAKSSSKAPQVEEPSPIKSAKKTTHHIRGRSFDSRAERTHLVSIDSSKASKLPQPTRRSPDVVELPREMKSIDLKPSSSSSFEGGDSVLSTASMTSALSTISSASGGSQPPAMPLSSGRHRRGRSVGRGNSLDGIIESVGSFGGSDAEEAKAARSRSRSIVRPRSQSFRKKASEDEMTVATEAPTLLSLPSISFSRSIESTRSRRHRRSDSVSSRELNISHAPKRLPAGKDSDDNSVATSEGYEVSIAPKVSIFPDKGGASDPHQEPGVFPRSCGSGRLAEMDRLKKLNRMNPKNLSPKSLDENTMRSERSVGEFFSEKSPKKKSDVGDPSVKKNEIVRGRKTSGVSRLRRSLSISHSLERARGEAAAAVVAAKSSIDCNARPSVPATLSPTRTKFRSRSMSRSPSLRARKGDGEGKGYPAPISAAAGPTGEEVELLRAATPTPSAPPSSPLGGSMRLRRLRSLSVGRGMSDNQDPLRRKEGRGESPRTEARPPRLPPSLSPKPYVVPGEERLTLSPLSRNRARVSESKGLSVRERYANKYGREIANAVSEKREARRIDDEDDASICSSISARAARRRSRSLSRSRVPPPSSSAPCSPPKRIGTSRPASPGTPPEEAAAAARSPLPPTTHEARRSASLAPPKVPKIDDGQVVRSLMAAALSPTRAGLASLSIPVLCRFVAPIQSLVRAYLARRAVAKRQRDIVVVQSVFRRWSAARYLKVARSVALACQSHYRGELVRDHLAYRHYCATKIQSALRGFLGFLAFMDSVTGIVILQSLWRMKVQQKRYSLRAKAGRLRAQRELRDARAAVAIQKNYRRRLALSDFMLMVSDVTLCQAAVRRRLATRRAMQLRIIESCATKIQSCWRRYLASEFFIFVVSDVIVCQSVVRRLIAARRCGALRDELRTRRSATAIQALYRGYNDRMNYRFFMEDVVFAQSMVRRWRARRRLAVLRVQSAKEHGAATEIRAAYLGYKGRIKYLATLYNVTACQCAVRKIIARKELKERQFLWALDVSEKERAATKIQAMYLGYVTRIDYLITISYAVIIQCAVRRMFARIRHAREEAATKIRSAYLGYIVRMDYIIAVSNIITCQSAVRKMIAMKESGALRHAKKERAVTKISATYRGYTARMRYIFSVADIISIQKCYRGFKARKTVEGLEGSATKIQAKVRGMTARRAFKCLLESRAFAATTIQKIYRGFVAYEYYMSVAGIISIQRCYRGFNARKLTKGLVESATRIQAIVRGVASRRAFKRVLESRELAAITIQKIYRGFVAYDGYVIKLASAIYCQATIRRFLAKKEAERMTLLRDVNEATTRIQSCWRSYRAYTNFGFAIWSVISLQSLVRRQLQIRETQQLRWHVVNENAARIQSCWRSSQARKRAFELHLESRENAAIMIQKIFRGFVAYEDYIMTVCSTIYCQSVIRQFLAKKELAMKMHWRSINETATTIQTLWRSYKIRSDYAYTLWGVISLQALFRGQIQIRRYRQYHWYTVHENATRIQTCWRSYKASTDYAFMIMGIISLQSLVRGRLQTRKYQQYQRYNLIEKVTRIQACWRGIKTRTDYAFQRMILHHAEEVKQMEHSAATAIQTCFRGYRDFLMYMVKTFSTINIQACIRGYLARCFVESLKQDRRQIMEHEIMILQQKREQERVMWEKEKERQRMIFHYAEQRKQSEHCAATAIQKCFRGYRDFLLFMIKTLSVINIQACIRGYQTRNLLKRQQMEEERMILQHVAATNIQTCFRGYREFVKFVIMQYFVIKIEALGRGFLVRCRLKRLNREYKGKQKEQKILKKNDSGHLRLLKPKKVQQEKKAALVIERFFIKIRADIDLEIARLEQKKARKVNKRQGRTNLDSSWKENTSTISSAYSFSGYSDAPPAPSRQCKEASRANRDASGTRAMPSHAQFQHLSAKKSGDNLLDSYLENAIEPRVRNASPSRKRMPSLQSVVAARNGGFNTASSKFHRNLMRAASPSSERLPQHGRTMSTASPSRERMPPIQSALQHGHKLAPSTSFNQRNGGQNAHTPQPRRNDMRNASLSRECMSQPMNAMRVALPSMQSVVQIGRKSSSNQTINPQNPMRNASPSRERMSPMQSVVTPTVKQAAMLAQSPSSYSNHYPPLNHTVHQQHTSQHDLPHDGSLQLNNSFSSLGPQNCNPASTRSSQSTSYTYQHQRNIPLPSTRSNISGINHYPQHQVHTSRQSATTPMHGNYAEHQRYPAQSQTPVQAQQKVKYQKSYRRY